MTLTARDPRASFTLMPSVRGEVERRTRGWDVPLALAVLALSALGVLLVWAATRDVQAAEGGNPQSFLVRDLINVAIAAVLVTLASRFDARLLRLAGPVVYVASAVGLVLVLVIGVTINGARAWIALGGGFELQPAEFMKLGLIAGMAVLFTERAEERRVRADRIGPDVDTTPTTVDVVTALALIVVPLGLIMLQPDLGSAMVLACAAFGVLIAAGVRARWTIGLLAVAVLGVFLVIRGGLLQGYQLARFASFIHPDHDVQGAAYNVHQAHIAIAHGGLFGSGLFRGTQTNGGYVPEQQTDFIFSVAGEELGLVGGAAIIALFGVVCWRGLRIARDAAPVGRLLAIGVVCWFAFQVFQNIGMNLGLTPVTGVPLPFVSYGGSSMFAQALAVGLLQAVHRRAIE